MTKRFQAHSAILGANLIYGINYTIAKGIMPDYVGAFGLTLMRVTGALLLFWAISFFIGTEKIDRKDFPRLILSGLFGVAINQMLFLKGLSFTTPINSSIIMTINPVLVLVIASIVLKERITWLKVIGIWAGGTGAGFLILNSGEISFQSETFLGNLMMFLNATSYAVYLVIVKPLMIKYKPITVVKWVFLFGWIVVTPIGFNEFTQINWSEMPTGIILSVVYVIIATTFFAYLLNISGLKYLKSSTVSVYIYSQPVIASIVAVILAKDELTWVKVVSTILVFIGVYLVSLPVERYAKNKGK
ncbi:MAG: DMT family transporter [Bacteroidales bacterium]|nr:DMT family transporter [Bacteroidales bacterium]MCF8457428.1 DMT family transporter [Bacteroidales bacterium]